MKNSKNKIEVKNKDFKIRKVLFIQTLQCIRTYKVAKALHGKGIQVDIVYTHAHPGEVYKDLKLPYTNIFRLQDIYEMISFINESDYDILYSSNEPDYLTVLFTSTNKPIVHDCHDMMSLRGHISNEQVILEYMANVQCDGNIYVNPLIKEIAVKKFGLKDKKILCLHSYVEKEHLPQKYYEKLSSKDNEIHCVFEGGLANVEGHHRFLENIFLKLAEEKIHVHLHSSGKPEYFKYLNEKSNNYIHWEGVKEPHDLITEMTKYDIGLAIFNLKERNKNFLDTAFPNKIWDYLAAGLPILFSELITFRMFCEENDVGNVLDLNADIKKQAQETMKINIDKDLLINKKWLMDEAADEIITFLETVKENYYKRSDLVSKEIKYYDEVYKNGGYKKNYFKPYRESFYIDIWYKALEMIKQVREVKIIDIGCGPGQFANLLFDNGIIKYKGIDFSEEAIKLAGETNQNYSHLFKVDNAYNSDVFSTDYNLVIMFEVLEHLQNDLVLLERIKKEANVLFTVPNYPSKGHVRVFKCEKDIENRYNKLIQIERIYTFNLNTKSKIFLVKGTKL